MAQLRSLYAAEVSAFVPTDSLSPKPPVATGTAQTISQDGGVTHGRSLVTIAWAAPTENEDIGGEFLIISTGGIDVAETIFDPVVSGPVVYEASNFGGGGRGDSTADGAIAKGDLVIDVVSATNFVANDWVQLADGSGGFEYLQIDSVNVNALTMKTKVQTTAGFLTGITVKEADMVTKTITTDYTIVLSTGVLTTVNGQFTTSNHVVIAYAATLQDLDGYELYRNLTSLTPDRATVIGDGGTVTVSTAIASGATSHQDTLSASENGETWYYYLYAKDDEASPNFSDIAEGLPLPIETIPSVPQNLGKTVADASVLLSWDSLGPGSSDANTDGYNIYRNTGGTLVQANLDKLNAIVIPKAQLSFQDNAAGVTAGDRVSAGTFALPINGNTYTYVVEAQDTASNWTTGTQNQSNGVSANLTGSQTP